MNIALLCAGALTALTFAVHLFSGEYQSQLSPAELVSQCWDLEELSAKYTKFNRYYEQQISEFKASADPDPAECFVRRFRLTVDLFPILQMDPNLPLKMLSADWPGTVGRKLFIDYRAMLTPIVDPFIDARVIQTA